jgi:uncharacterized membrane protein YkgB
MKLITSLLLRMGVLRDDLDYHLIRASMVIIFLFFGYQKWFEYEAQALVPYISHGPLIFWMYPVFGIRGATYFLGVSEWLFGALLFAGFWNKNLGILGALGSCFSFVATSTLFQVEGNHVSDEMGPANYAAHRGSVANPNYFDSLAKQSLRTVLGSRRLRSALELSSR